MICRSVQILGNAAVIAVFFIDDMRLDMPSLVGKRRWIVLVARESLSIQSGVLHRSPFCPFIFSIPYYLISFLRNHSYENCIATEANI